ncbi:hypothetical protein [Massilia sp. BSC265]|uniref:hypothetical protein n=1 Tax=Massilia sp. BSC265 TaxID=1549812 RepID=UPI0004E90E1E|nr:hypothetical protein [Massilia sp. BSC265]KFI07869.1 hypothetical protein JN27_07270 [Massilia sp. BSC265]
MLTAFGAAGAATLAALAAHSLATAGPNPEARGTGGQAFDPLFAPGAICTPARAGRPPLLERLVLAQPPGLPRQRPRERYRWQARPRRPSRP